MKKTKFLFTALAALSILAAVLLFAACSNDNGNNTGDTGDPDVIIPDDEAAKIIKKLIGTWSSLSPEEFEDCEENNYIYDEYSKYFRNYYFAEDNILTEFYSWGEDVDEYEGPFYFRKCSYAIELPNTIIHIPTHWGGMTKEEAIADLKLTDWEADYQWWVETYEELGWEPPSYEDFIPPYRYTFEFSNTNENLPYFLLDFPPDTELLILFYEDDVNKENPMYFFKIN
jgi:hypothetical protein